MTPHTALERGLEQFALDLPASAREQLLQYQALLVKWNRVYNLTAIRDPLGMVSHHLLDSLAVLPHLSLPAGARVADAGSGAGLPGIPLALARPQWRVALIEANQKKAAFLRQASIELELRNVEVHEGRAEAWRPAEAFALVVSRAFTSLAEFVATCRHLVAPRGLLAAMKGKHPRAELGDLPADVRCKAVIALNVPFVKAERHLVLCELGQ
ncbi:MAG: 16S rRNA (guanine(527)-N(7))-methyltransferase RsmG [Betaproteobacteria bacterium]|nr:MAG: 16S rRNA (guanine(527)-N(7))-methyltransferase RsmG [Betaproteobacteria bacterium]TMH45550.1 MAG: 16S rRNA (guanine(527)-N(7))-methyltransferase RsmG [Betaproteobacteria bacterium]